MNSLKYGLPNSTIDSIKDVINKHSKIEKIILYGSRAKGNYKPGSDIDLTLVAPTMELTELLKIETELDDLMLPYKIDLSLFHMIDNPELIEHIKRVGLEFR